MDRMLMGINGARTQAIKIWFIIRLLRNKVFICLVTWRQSLDCELC